MSTDRRSDDGFAILEALVALAIAAGVLTATMAGLANLARGARQVDQVQQALLEAQNIESRLRAGLPIDALSGRYPDWRIEFMPVDRPVDPRTGAVLTGVTLERVDLPGWQVRLVYVETTRAPDFGGSPHEPG
ncbi:hypothetical protein AWH62_11335 [Maricaulis sp. W15]|uniref:type IV pilus modification PilV family protein n=1 Tax=Maricaulis sp. W15 TaxID=1772333 RepID=UPI000948A711|nr:type II secretion system protein [Maricaulis sp. W15]OLF71726.1 hypothetical protein AWH62_11335 [Maricaulis sp. W15]